jgi:hypothetical protein
VTRALIRGPRTCGRLLMGDEALNPAQQSEYRFLKQQVDRLLGEVGRTDSHPNVQQDLWRAQQELKKFVVDLRKAGIRI